MKAATASDLAKMKQAINFLLRKRPDSQRSLDTTLRLVEDLCQVIRRAEGIDGIVWANQEDKHGDHDSEGHVPSERPGDVETRRHLSGIRGPILRRST